jgi:hypothetical protein
MSRALFAFPAGGAGGGLSFGNVPLRTIDPTSWSTNDPDSLLKSVSHTAGTGVTTFTFKELSVGSATYQLTNSTQDYPRRYTDLQADNGDGTFTTLTTDDFALIYFRLSGYTTDFASRLFVSVAIDPTSSAATTQSAYGVFFRKPASTVGSGLWDTAYAQIGLGNPVSVHGVLNYSPLRSIGLTQFDLVSAGTPLFVRQRYPLDTLSSGINLQLMVGVATETNGTTITDNDTVAAKLEYQAFKLNI